MNGRSSPSLVLLAAGRSTRYGTPKQLAPLGPDGESLTAYLVVDALRAGFGRIVVVTSRELQPRLEAHLQAVLGEGLPVDWAIQELEMLPDELRHLGGDRAKPWGTAQAILAAAPLLRGAFGVANADDWYGPEAVRALASALSSMGEGTPSASGSRPDPCPAVAVGYPMRVTLSPSGGVSRGWITADTAGRIRRVLELRDVRSAGQGRILGVDPEGLPVAVPPDTPASMNLWGFHPCLLSLLQEAFRVFLLESGADLVSEFALSTAVDRLLEAEALDLRLIPEGRRWFGVTHPGDADTVARKLEALHADGTYPDLLSQALD
jgi:hypothetical protein